jgi:hypothetical protein
MISKGKYETPITPHGPRSDILPLKNERRMVIVRGARHGRFIEPSDAMGIGNI